MLTFDYASHTYRTPEGVVVPSVTQILKATGMSTDFETLTGMSARLAAQINYRRDLGTAVHADAHAYDDNDLDLDAVSPVVRPYLDAWATCRANLGLTPLVRERIVYHPTAGYCGMLDGIFRRDEKCQKILLDLKIGDPEDAAADLQTAAYEGAYRLDGEHQIDERWSVQLLPGRRVPYKVTVYDDWQDFETFKACVTVYKQLVARKRLREVA